MKEKIITVLSIAVLAVCLFIFSGCGSNEGHLSVEDIEAISNTVKLESHSDCLSCIGCDYRYNHDSCGAGGTYYGCIDCFGATASDEKGLDEYFSSTKICGGCFGTSCFSCYCVNYPIVDSDNKVKPVYGCLACS